MAEGQLYILSSDGPSPFQKRVEFADDLLGNVNFLFGAADGQQAIPGDQTDVETILNHSNVFIIPAEKGLDVRSRRQRDLSSNGCALAFHVSQDASPHERNQGTAPTVPTPKCYSPLPFNVN